MNKNLQDKVVKLLNKKDPNYDKEKLYQDLINILGNPVDGDIKKRVNHIVDHRNAIIMVSKQYGVYQGNEVRFDYHDIDKLVNIFLYGNDKAKKLHKTQGHHAPITKSDYQEAIMDWECARITKPDKPLNAFDTYFAYYKGNPVTDAGYEKALKQLNLWNKKGNQ